MKTKSLLLLLLLLLGLSACTGSTAERLWLKAPGWSRAQWIGETQISEAVPIALDEAGGIYLFLIHGDKNITHPQVVALNRQTETVWTRTFETALIKPEQPQILWDGQMLHLFWLDNGGLYTARLDTAGNIQDSPILLSGEITVGSYDAAQDTNGLITVWYGGRQREPGVYALPSGNPTGEAILVDADGIQPTLQYDDSDRLHAIWAVYLSPGSNSPGIYYGAYPGGVYRLGQAVLATELSLRSDSRLQGFRIGLDQQYVYLFWTEFILSGRQTGLTPTKYVYFPVDKPASISKINSLTVPYVYDLLYQTPPNGALKSGSRASLMSGKNGGIALPAEITINPAFEPELVLALRVPVQYRYRSTVEQIGTLFLQGGQPRAYQLLTFTPVTSIAPAIISDKAGYLYLTWLEPGQMSGLQVYFAGTAPDIRDALNPLTGDDINRMGVNTFFGLLQGAVYSPFAFFLWLIVPVLLLAVTWSFRRRDKSLVDRRTLISLTLALAAFWAGKLITLSDALTYVPFSAWIPVIPAWLGLVLQVAVPIAIVTIALKTAWHYTGQRAIQSAFLFLLVYGVVDSVLTMAIYSGLLFDAF